MKIHTNNNMKVNRKQHLSEVRSLQSLAFMYNQLSIIWSCTFFSLHILVMTPNCTLKHTVVHSILVDAMI